MVAGRENITAALAAYLKTGMELTASSVRSYVAPAFGRSSCLAFGFLHQHMSNNTEA
jgi:hypothetical protein